MDRSRIPGLTLGKRHPDWIKVYEGQIEKNLPWHFPELDPDIKKELARYKGKGKSLLDLGCGLGTQTSHMEKLGFQVTGTDISPTAIKKANEQYPHMTFITDDIMQTKLSSNFDIIVDRGCFHVLEPELSGNYVKTISQLLGHKGVYLLKVLNSEQGNADFGPIRFSLFQLHMIFRNAFELIRVHRTIYYGSTPVSPLAWFLVMRKKEMKNG